MLLDGKYIVANGENIDNIVNTLKGFGYIFQDIDVNIIKTLMVVDFSIFSSNNEICVCPITLNANFSIENLIEVNIKQIIREYKLKRILK